MTATNGTLKLVVWFYLGSIRASLFLNPVRMRLPKRPDRSTMQCMLFERGAV